MDIQADVGFVVCTSTKTNNYAHYTSYTVENKNRLHTYIYIFSTVLDLSHLLFTNIVNT